MQQNMTKFTPIHVWDCKNTDSIKRVFLKCIINERIMKNIEKVNRYHTNFASSSFSPPTHITHCSSLL